MAATVFEIRVLPPEELSLYGDRMGLIRIGDFVERFSCNDHFDLRVEDFEAHWRRELQRLLRGVSSVPLIHEPMFAWIVFRLGDECFVQQRMSVDCDFRVLSPRETISEDGLKISDWPVTLGAIQRFVDTEESSHP
ncbi:MAG: hypothetical protein AAF078_06495 [Planctomycetota bacterium]